MAGPPTAVIYFRPVDGAMAKDLAARIRNDPRNIKTRLCWGDRFRDERDLEACQAVIIQRSLRNVDLISTCYRNFSDGTQIHYIDDNGTFEDEGEFLDEGAVGEALGPESDTPVLDPTAAEAPDEPEQPGPGDPAAPEATAETDAAAEAGSGEAPAEPDPAAP